MYDFLILDNGECWMMGYCDYGRAREEMIADVDGEFYTVLSVSHGVPASLFAQMEDAKIGTVQRVDRLFSQCWENGGSNAEERNAQ